LDILTDNIQSSQLCLGFCAAFAQISMFASSAVPSTLLAAPATRRNTTQHRMSGECHTPCCVHQLPVIPKFTVLVLGPVVGEANRLFGLLA
jgi:hypothetical protein